MALVFDVIGPLSIDNVVRALVFMCASHESFRTVFSGFGPKMKQIILHEATIPLHVDFETPDVQEWVGGKAFAALDTARAPVVCGVLALNADRFVLTLVVHHYLADGWSAVVICRDFSAAYRAASMGSSVAHEPVRQYREFTVDKLKSLQDEDAPRFCYWRRQLDGHSSRSPS